MIHNRYKKLNYLQTITNVINTTSANKTIVFIIPYISHNIINFSSLIVMILLMIIMNVKMIIMYPKIITITKQMIPIYNRYIITIVLAINEIPK